MIEPPSWLMLCSCPCPHIILKGKSLCLEDLLQSFKIYFNGLIQWVVPTVPQTHLVVDWWGQWAQARTAGWC